MKRDVLADLYLARRGGMTPEEILEEASEQKLILYRGIVFFNTRDAAVANHFRSLGCHVEPWYTEDEIRFRSHRGHPSAQGYEVHLLNALTPIWGTDENGDEVEITARVLYARARDVVFA